MPATKLARSGPQCMSFGRVSSNLSTSSRPAEESDRMQQVSEWSLFFFADCKGQSQRNSLGPLALSTAASVSACFLSVAADCRAQPYCWRRQDGTIRRRQSTWSRAHPPNSTQFARSGAPRNGPGFCFVWARLRPDRALAPAWSNAERNAVMNALCLTARCCCVSISVLLFGTGSKNWMRASVRASRSRD